MRSNSKHKSIFHISYNTFAITVCALPSFATLFCVIWSVIFNFEESTRTHCKVRNYLPSVSAAIGSFSPQKYVWRICIALHSTPRLMQAFSYYNFYTSVHVGKGNRIYTFLASVNSLAHIFEIISLVGLSYISSTENHGVHELCFIMFMLCSIVYMGITILLYSWGKPGMGNMQLYERSLKWKKRCCLLNYSSFALSLYLFFRHNWYCEPGVFSLFCLSEYVVIASNVCFHYSATWDFHAAKVTLLKDDQWSLPR